MLHCCCVGLRSTSFIYHHPLNHFCLVPRQNFRAGGLFTTSSSFLLRPGHHTEFIALSLTLHLAVPWWASWILSRTYSHMDTGMTRWLPFISKPCCIVSSFLSGQWSLSCPGIQDLFGHWVEENSIIYLVTSSSCCWHLSFSSQSSLWAGIWSLRF